MNHKKVISAVALTAAGALTLAGCSGGTKGGSTSPSDTGSATTPARDSISIAWEAPLNSLNLTSNNGNATQNTVIASLLDGAFYWYDEDLATQDDESFGTIEKISDDPLQVKYTYAADTNWSDGVPVGAADLLLEWAATSTHFNTVDIEDEVDEEGNIDVADDQVAFNSAITSSQLIEDFPEVSADGKSITFTYSKKYADWQYSFDGRSLPAHIVAKRALGIDDPTAATEALIKAFKDKDNAALAKVSKVWNDDFNFTTLPSEPELYLSNGAYVLKDYVKDQYLTLAANPDYKGARPASIPNVTVRFIEDPMAQVTALQNGEVDLIGPQASADVRTALENLGDQVVTSFGVEGTYEHVDLVFQKGSPFSAATYGGDEEKALKVRQAFLQTIPRQAIVDNLIKSSNPDAAVRNSFILVPGSEGYDEMVAQNGSSAYPDAGDIAKATELLKEAGVDTPVKVRFAFNADNARRVSQFALIQDAAKQAGFDVVDASAPAADWGTLLAQKQSEYDASLFGWQTQSTAVTEADPNYRTGGINNFGLYSSKVVDGLLDELQVETDPAKQLELQIKVEQELWKDAFGTVIFQFPAIHAWTPTLDGVKPSAISPTIFNQYWEWKAAA
ncbi:ABC transporter family substrate-binding protein [Rarobacter faecitabidus]|uniref:Peptide/nickel transport system substrate-binding protein n=1 Tax=Rarobacter faecitabidus TaxID=13243 RepID=A0A542ZUU4_RARFA|nr:ABC transporter family substrate-binding protein [Rarobacter faecitabidus]TQL64026.1 peptide/nickel transport system substrate-binding protein [Rarobacter faecitabidus]